MIIHIPENTCCPQSIQFSPEGKDKLIKVLERGLNTYSPPDPELLDLLDSLKEKS
jgi:hypothetical protein